MFIKISLCVGAVQRVEAARERGGLLPSERGAVAIQPNVRLLGAHAALLAAGALPWYGAEYASCVGLPVVDP